MKKMLSIGFFTVLFFSLFTACNLNVQTTDNPLEGNWTGGGVTLRVTGQTYTLNFSVYTEHGSCLNMTGQINFTTSGKTYTCQSQLTNDTLTITYPTPADVIGRPTGLIRLTKQ